MKTAFAVIVLAILGTAFAQTGQQVKQDSLLERARKGDDSALSEMEESGDTQDLQSLLNDPHYAGKSAARLRLARMGDQKALQYYACRLLNTLQKGTPSGDEVELVGGSFEIQLYRQVLDSDQRFLAGPGRTDQGSDALTTLPSSAVLFTLPKLLPNAGIPAPVPLLVQARKDGDLKARWRAWIDSHQTEIQKLKPTAKGINLDWRYCSEFNDANRR